MEKIVLCPGRIPIRNSEQPWFSPVNDGDGDCNEEGKVICECCYKYYGKDLDSTCYKIVYGPKYHCSNKLRSFDELSITINNIRLSVINPDNFFRYRMTRTISEIIFHIPKDERYQIIIENLDQNDIKTKISVDLVNYDDIEVRYYDKKYPYYLIIDNEDYLAYHNMSRIEQKIDFIIKKWRKLDNNYIRDENDAYFDIKLEFCDNEEKIMNSVIEINKNMPDNNHKIILIDNFI